MFGEESEVKFFDIETYNTDTFILNEEDKQKQTDVADIYFRISVNELKHRRNVETIVDFLGNIAGITDLLSLIVLFIVGGYSTFYSNVQMISSLYGFKHKGKRISLKLPNTKRFCLFLQRAFGCCETKKSNTFLKMIEKGE